VFAPFFSICKAVVIVNISSLSPALKAVTVEDKINKVEKLTELIEQRGILKAHLNRVDALKFGEFDEKDALTITSKSGNSYTIINSSLMSDIAKLCKDRISNEIARVEQLIEF